MKFKSLFELKDYNKVNLLMGLSLFSVLFWVGAVLKPMHVDEFYSWLYTQRYGLSDILAMKEMGIGHPPLYHLVQKMSQWIFDIDNLYLVRLPNYLLGIVFITLFVKFMARINPVEKYQYFGVFISASILDTFILARMWGLLCLASLLLLMTYYSYRQAPVRENKLKFILAVIFGLMSDFNFLVFLPMFFYVIFDMKSFKKSIVISSAIILLLWVVKQRNYTIDRLETTYLRLISNVQLFFTEFLQSVFNFWYWEIFALAIFSAILLTIKFMKKEAPLALVKFLKWALFPGLAGMVLLEFLHVQNFLSSFPVFILASGVIGFNLYFFIKLRVFDLLNNDQRVVLGVYFFTFILILFMTSVFWRNLVNVRFLVLLVPWTIFFLIRTLNVKQFNIVNIIMIISGLFYGVSSGIAQSYPANIDIEGKNIIHYNPNTISTYYFFYRENPQNIPYILNKTNYQKSCRICDFGDNRIPYDELNRLLILAKKSNDYSDQIPAEFTLEQVTEASYNYFDNRLGKIFTPVYKNKYFLYELNKAKK